MLKAASPQTCLTLLTKHFKALQKAHNSGKHIYYFVYNLWASYICQKSWNKTLNIRLTCAAMLSLVRRLYLNGCAVETRPGGTRDLDPEFWVKTLFKCAICYEFCRFKFVIDVKLACYNPSLGTISENGIKIKN